MLEALDDRRADHGGQQRHFAALGAEGVTVQELLITSFLLLRRMGALLAKPADQRLPLSPEAAGRIQSGPLCIVGTQFGSARG